MMAAQSGYQLCMALPLTPTNSRNGHLIPTLSLYTKKSFCHSLSPDR